MQLHRVVAALLWVLCYGLLATARNIPYPRQESHGDALSGTDSALSTSSAFLLSESSSIPTVSASPSANTEQRAGNSLDPGTTATAVSLSTTDSAIVAVTSATQSPDSVSATSTASAQATGKQGVNRPLPLQPKITPALGIAGVLLIFSGLALALIGIKHDWIHVFLSTALLASLSITVLVLYVENPPVSNAVQGAYFVAACLTGLILGGLALVFREITECLGCLLGGFTLGMWFLMLSPGGLVQSTIGKIIFIVAFCCCGSSLSFSIYTRNYGLIICTSFAGAMTTILGVDCFSCAGLKEFWVYLWDLNDDIFPLNTTTYPVTRGIRVEIAGTIILFVFGLMSQMKIWKVVRERRLRKEAQRMRDEEDKDQLESSLGRNIEERRVRDLQVWEAAYGDKNAVKVTTDSAVDSPMSSLRYGSESGGRNGVELHDFVGHSSRRSSRLSSKSIVVMRVSSDNTDCRHESQVRLVEGQNEVSSWDHSETSSQSQDHPEVGEIEWRASQGPPIVPLPFPLPADDSEVDARFVGSPTRRSSIAATAALGDRDNDWLSQHRLSTMFPADYALPGNRDSLMVQSDDRPDSPRPGSRLSMERPFDEEDDEALPKPAVKSPEQDVQERNSSGSRTSVHRATRSKGSNSSAADLVDHLDQSLSKVAAVYRTNEWAKHITNAEEPVADDSNDDSGYHSPGIKVDTAFAEEAAKAVDVQELSKSAPLDSVAPLSSSETRKTSDKNPFRRRRSGNNAMVRQSSLSSTKPVYAFQRTESQSSMSPQANRTSSISRPVINRASGSLMAMPLVESPAEDQSSLPRESTTIAPYTNTPNLLDQRTAILKRRPTTQSFVGQTVVYSPHQANVTGPSDAASVCNRSVRFSEAQSQGGDALEEDENMTLSQRKELMQQRAVERQSHSGQQSQRHATSGIKRQGSHTQLWWSRPMSTQQNGNVIYNSHQPQRMSSYDSIKQNTILAQWRCTLQQDAMGKHPPISEELARQQMMADRRQAERQQQMQSLERANRESMRDYAMRSGRLHSTHQDAIRRMQAEANKHSC